MVWIKKVHAKSLGPFDDTGVIELAPTMNIIVGENNSGKSSLLNALIAPLLNSPHRDPTRFLPGDVVPTQAWVTFVTSTSEIRELMARHSTKYRVMFSQDRSDLARVTNFFRSSAVFELGVSRSGGQPSNFIDPTDMPWIEKGASQNWTRLALQNGEILAEGYGSEGPFLSTIFDGSNNPPIFKFDSLRVPPSRCTYGESPILSPNADNLPRVVAYIQNRNPDRFRQIISFMDDVIGSVKNISVFPIGDQCEIFIWPSNEQFDDLLSFPLSSSGTGVAQVLSILVAASSSHPSTIVIDEINSFLHPAAVKRLLKILRLYYPRHQYIISTHSADVISHALPETILFVERSGFLSNIKMINPNQRSDLRIVSQVLGFSLTEVFGVDNILWVEGETEEEIARLCHEHLMGRVPPNCKIAKVSDTGLFESRRTKDAVARVYKHVAEQISPAVGVQQFVLDRETRSDDAVESAVRATDGKVGFLERRHIECYLIDPHAISNLLASIIERPAQELEKDITDKLCELAGEQEFGASRFWNGDLSNSDWRKRVDAAKLISRVVSTISCHKLEYNKRINGPQIFRSLLIRDDPEARCLLNFFAKQFALAKFPDFDD